MPIPITFDDGIAVLRLELGRGNAIDPAFISALNAALDEVERSDARALVITGKGRVFCGGLDLVTLGGFDRPTMERFIDDFDALFRRVFAFERPVVAAVNGHAIAGGAVLALSCDLRVMAEGPHQFGLNEVQLGIPFPPATFEIVRRATPAAARSAVLLQGRRFSPAEAHRLGLVHRLAGEAGVVADALDEARLFAAAGPQAVRAVKAALVERVLARIDAGDPGAAARKARFAEAWWSPEARRRIGALRDELLAKQKPAG